jgi:antirestriction protein ArdC
MNESIRVAEALERGEIPWRLPAFPHNVCSGKPYGGVSPILLNIAAGALGCSSPWWGTRAEWAAVGNKVPFGLGAWLPGYKQALYNLESTDRAYEPPPLPEENTAQVFEAIVRGVGVRVHYVYNATCKYAWAGDTIVMPHPWMFAIGPGGPDGYWDALGHELFHATERRTAWDAHPDVNELRAEIGTGYLGALAGARPLPLRIARHHRRFAPRWARLLRREPRLLLRVCDHVVATLDYLFRLVGRGSVVSFAPDNPVLPEEGGE